MTDVILDPNMAQVGALLTKAQIYAGGIIVGFGGLMGMVSGLMRVAGMREEAERRWKDVMWGTAQAITAPACVLLIATIMKAFLPVTHT